MTEKAIAQAYSLYQQDIDRVVELTDALYPLRGERRLSETVRRLIRAAQVVDGRLVADEREPREANDGAE